MKMVNVRRYLRGSGRVLAFVFVASVIWLLFDMAALRMSINDVNSQLLKERVIREKEMMVKQQSRVTQLVMEGFKHPVQKVHLAVTRAWKRQKSNKLAQAYRRGGKEHEVNSNQKQVVNSVRSRSHNDGATPSKQEVQPQKQAVNLDISEAVAHKTQRPPGVQINQNLLNSGLVKTAHFAQNQVDRTNSKTGQQVKGASAKNQTKVRQLQVEEAHPAQIIAHQNPNKNVNRKEENMEAKRVGVPERTNLNVKKEHLKPTVPLRAKENSGVNSTTGRKAGVHKVLHLDMTQAPRDPKAVGQFGQAVLLPRSDDAEVKKRWDEGHFNVYLSDQIPVDRAVPDTRPERWVLRCALLLTLLPPTA